MENTENVHISFHYKLVIHLIGSCCHLLTQPICITSELISYRWELAFWEREREEEYYYSPLLLRILNSIERALRLLGHIHTSYKYSKIKNIIHENIWVFCLATRKCILFLTLKAAVASNKAFMTMIFTKEHRRNGRKAFI